MKKFYAQTIVGLLILAMLSGYAGAAAPAPAAAAPQTFAAASAPLRMPSLTPDQLSKLYQVYTIKRGDSLILIGRQFGVPWRYIAALNGIEGPEYTIITGQTLKIPLLPKLPGATGNYLILCETEAQKKCLSEFAAFKTWSGYTVTVKSVEADVKPKAKADPCDAIRQYLKKMDQKLSTEYVLLIGDPYNAESCCPQHTGGIIPMRYLYYNPSNHNTRYDWDWYDLNDPEKNGFNTPTDIFYAFDFEWDIDADGFPGEMDEIVESVTKAKPELLFLLGRIPFSDTKDISTMLNATMQYELGQKIQSNALIEGAGGFAFYGDSLAGNLTRAKIETVTIFGDEGDEPCKYKGTYLLNDEIFNDEASKKYDFVYTANPVYMRDINSNPGNGVLAGIFFMDSTASMKIEPGEGDPQITAQEFLANGTVSAVIANTRTAGYNPSNPNPRMASLLFSHGTLCVSREFYAVAQSMIVNSSDWGDITEAYIYCYLGDPSIALKP